MPLKDLLTIVEDESVEYIDLKYTDLLGLWRHVTIPAARLTEEFLQNGIGVDGSSISGFRKVKSGDMTVIPDTAFYFIDPFLEQNTLSIIGDFRATGESEGYSRDPRYVAKKAERYLAESGIADDILFGPEFEFYLFDEVRYRDNVGSSYFHLVSSEDIRSLDNRDFPGHGVGMDTLAGYHAAPPRDKSHDFRSWISSLLGDAGVEIKYHHHEVGGPGQQEIELMFGGLLETADRTMLVKYLVRNGALEWEKSATFMPKPIFGAPGSGLHFHQYLVRGEASIFHSDKHGSGLNDTARYYIGGLLAHARALCAFTNPSTNSYRRLIPGFEAPVRLAYSVGNRTAAIRIPGYTRNPARKRLEYRPPDATCNPYFCLAAMLMAGLDGIENQLDPGDPLDMNLFEISDEDLSRIPALPRGLEEALDALMKDSDFLRKDDVFTEDLIEAWVRIKSEEVVEMKNRPHPYEFHLYYDL
jgi:glutamine synthetase